MTLIGTFAKLLSYIFNDKLKSEEGAEILRVIKECEMASTEEEWLKQIK